ncbi:MAG TPA: cell division protein ZapA [Candidatus Aerophobetes bacterium]|uniref:Cell division protein ZapA n=1 Tax=Aerophobetes bacterium TaxID=2030807 RepID=A0A7V5HY45_UNCAE|nr:cell division protein ZapA [Candidatus Aerophobetes bacterium]
MYNREYNLRAETREDEHYIRQVASYVDKKIKEISSSSPNKSFEQICILASLNIAAELLDLKNKNLKAKEKLKNLLTKLTKKS